MDGKPEPPQLTIEELNRWFRRFLYDPEFRDSAGSRTVPIAPLLRYAGTARQNVWAMFRGEFPLTPNYRRRLSAAIYDVQRGLRFRRVNRVYQIVGPFQDLPRRHHELLRQPRDAHSP